jgi:uncharacterized protein (UPF0332 family)
VFDWEELLVLADRLAQETADEAAHRTAISRAYYAAYHTAAAYVRAQNLLQTRHTHASVWGAFTTDLDDERADVGRWGEILRRRRVAADYSNPFLGDVGGQARAAVAEARTLIAILHRLR